MSIEYRREGKYRFRILKDGIYYSQNYYSDKKLSDKDLEEKKYPKEVIDAHKKFEVDIMRGEIGTNENMLFKDLVQLFMDEYMVNLRASTQLAYESIANNHLIKDFGNMPLSKIKTLHIQKALNEKLEKYTPSTVSAIYKEINKTFNKAVEWGLLTESPCKNIKIPKPKRKNYEELLSNDNIKKLMKAIEIQPIMYKTIFSISIYTGIRQGEILGLHIPDINFDEKYINVDKQNARAFDENRKVIRVIADTKTENSVRKVFVPDFLLEIIREYINSMRIIPKDGALFYNPFKKKIYSREAVAKRFKLMLLENDIPYIRFHDSRHLYATIALNSGANIVSVARSMGDTVETVLKNYTHGIEDLHKKATYDFEDYIKKIQ